MTKTEKMKNIIAEKRKQATNLEAAMIEAETKEERKKIGDTLASLKQEIADYEDIVKELDEPAGDPAPADPAARGFSVVGTMTNANGTPDAAAKAEARAKAFADSGRMSVGAEEARSVLLASGTIAKPTGVGGINDPFNTVSSIVDMVQVEDMTGMGAHNEAYVKAWQTADKGTDGTAPTASDPEFRQVAINPFYINTITYVSEQLKKQTPLQYEAKVKQGALIALKKKLAGMIVGGNGTTQMYGIVNAVNTEKTPESMIETVDIAKIDEKTLRTIVFAYGGDENIAGNAVLFLNKKDLIAFGDVRGTNEKKAVYEIIPDGSNPNKGIIKDGGLSVPYCICSDCAAFVTATGTTAGVKTMIYGTPTNYKLGLFGNYEVKVSEDYKFGEGLLTVRGTVMAGGNVTMDKGFVAAVKKSAS